MDQKMSVKVNQEMWSVQLGKCEVIDIADSGDLSNNRFPIICKNSAGRIEQYDYSGVHINGNGNKRHLFFKNEANQVGELNEPQTTTTDIKDEEIHIFPKTYVSW